MIEENLDQARTWISDADALLIGAGAGMGVDSGLPDFRGNAGFWKAYPPIRDRGLSFVDMANPAWFEKDPALAWGFYGHRLNLYRATDAHPGFRKLLEYGRTLPGGFFVYTSNVDGQFQKAGFSADRVVECHGSIHHLQCTGSCSQAIWSAESVEVEVDETTCRAAEPLPLCPTCGALARPNILMFGDWMWSPERTNDQTDRFERWKTRVRDNLQRIVVIEVGAGTAIPSVRCQCEEICSTHMASLIRVNPRDYQVPPDAVGIPLGGRAGIDALFDEEQQEDGRSRHGAGGGALAIALLGSTVDLGLRVVSRVLSS
jgi:NAD-dependent SIR2 family protein deacetylase